MNTENEYPEARIKHLELIQSIITRMNSNSFQIKGWAITIVSALLALYAGKDENTTFILVAIAPTLLFWFLDAYYLQQERKFRGLYIAAIEHKVKVFTMDITKYKETYSSAFWSKTIWILYSSIISLLFIGWLLLTHWDTIKNCI